MINMRGIVTLIIIALSSLAACESRAQDRHPRPAKVTCKVVRDFVAMVGAEQAERMAREAGASEERLEEARRCVQGSPK